MILYFNHQAFEPYYSFQEILSQDVDTKLYADMISNFAVY